MNKIFKSILIMLSLLLSPLATIAVFGAAYIGIRVICGLKFSAAVSSFKVIIYNLKPYFPYLTMVPVVSFIFPLFIKKKIKVTNPKK